MSHLAHWSIEGHADHRVAASTGRAAMRYIVVTNTSLQQFACIISGPSMGGKSTYLKAIGIALMLTQMDSFLPARTAATTTTRLPVFDRLFLRSGVTDCSRLGISSFMVSLSCVGLLRLNWKRRSQMTANSWVFSILDIWTRKPQLADHIKSDALF